MHHASSVSKETRECERNGYILTYLAHYVISQALHRQFLAITFYLLFEDQENAFFCYTFSMDLDLNSYLIPGQNFFSIGLFIDQCPYWLLLIISNCIHLTAGYDCAFIGFPDYLCVYVGVNIIWEVIY